MKVRGTIEFEIDDEAFAEHDGEQEAPPNDITDWDYGDLFRARDLALTGLDGVLDLERVSDDH